MKQLFFTISMMLFASVAFTGNVYAQSACYYDGVTSTIYVRFDPQSSDNYPYIDIDLNFDAVGTIMVSVNNKPGYVSILGPTTNGSIRVELSTVIWNMSGKPSSGEIYIVVHDTGSDKREVRKFSIYAFEG